MMIRALALATTALASSAALAGPVFLEEFETYALGSSPVSGGVWTSAGVLGITTVVQPSSTVSGTRAVNLKPSLLGQFIQSAGIRRPATDQFGFPTQVITAYFLYTNPSASSSRFTLQCQGLTTSITPDLSLAISQNAGVTFTSNGTPFTTTLPNGVLKQGWNRVDMIQDRTSFPYTARFAVNGFLSPLVVPATGDFYYQTQIAIFASGTTDAIQVDGVRYWSVNPDETYFQFQAIREDYSADPSLESLRLNYTNLNNGAFSFSSAIETDREGYYAYTLPRSPSSFYNVPYNLSVVGQTWLNSYVGFLDASFYSKSWRLYPRVILKNGDTDRDNEITILDYLTLSAAYGRAAGDPGYNRAADFDFDGEVSILDYLILSKNYDLVGYPY